MHHTVGVVRMAGIGRPVHTCPEHSPEQDGLLCYPDCRDGFNGVGPVCWENVKI